MILIINNFSTQIFVPTPSLWGGEREKGREELWCGDKHKWTKWSGSLNSLFICQTPKTVSQKNCWVSLRKQFFLGRLRASVVQKRNDFDYKMGISLSWVVRKVFMKWIHPKKWTRIEEREENIAKILNFNAIKHFLGMFDQHTLHIPFHLLHWQLNFHVMPKLIHEYLRDSSCYSAYWIKQLENLKLTRR
jgi:hypothetical protein